MISIDITLIIQLVNFLLSLCIINFLIIKPVRANLKKRRSMVDGDLGFAGKYRQNAEVLTLEYDNVIAKVRADISTKKHVAKEEAENSANAMINESTDNAREIRVLASNTIREESEKAQKMLKSNISAYTKIALTKVLN